jgi:hypothetical protein
LGGEFGCGDVVVAEGLGDDRGAMAKTTWTVMALLAAMCRVVRLKLQVMAQKTHYGARIEERVTRLLIYAFYVSVVVLLDSSLDIMRADAVGDSGHPSHPGPRHSGVMSVSVMMG